MFSEMLVEELARAFMIVVEVFVGIFMAVVEALTSAAYKDNGNLPPPPTGPTPLAF
jgi:hypothetical protein